MQFCAFVVKQFVKPYRRFYQMRKIFNLLFLFLLLINAKGQETKSLTKIEARVQSIKKAKHFTAWFYQGPINDTLKTNYDVHLLGKFKKRRIIEIYFKNEQGMDITETIFFVADSSLIAIEDITWSIIIIGGPNVYEQSYKGNYYFKGDSVIKQTVTGQNPYKQDATETLVKMFNHYRELLEEINNAEMKKRRRAKVS